MRLRSTSYQKGYVTGPIRTENIVQQSSISMKWGHGDSNVARNEQGAHGEGCVTEEFRSFMCETKLHLFWIGTF